jgi:hypothetical protein
MSVPSTEIYKKQQIGEVEVVSFSHGPSFVIADHKESRLGLDIYYPELNEDGSPNAGNNATPHYSLSWPTKLTSGALFMALENFAERNTAIVPIHRRPLQVVTELGRLGWDSTSADPGADNEFYFASDEPLGHEEIKRIVDITIGDDQRLAAAVALDALQSIFEDYTHAR